MTATTPLHKQYQEIKQRYRDNPEAARVPAHAEATLDLNDVACAVPGWHGETKAARNIDMVPLPAGPMPSFYRFGL